MKYIKIYVLVFLLIPSLVFSSDDGFSFLGIKAKNVVAFAGPFIEFSSVDKYLFTINGGKGAFAVSEKYYVGLYGLNSTTNLTRQIDGVGEAKLRFGHFGIWMGYMYKSWRSIRISFSMKSGIGGISIYQEKYRSYNHKLEVSIDELDRLKVGVISPSVDFSFGVFKWLAVSTTAGYHVLIGKETHYINPQDFSSPAITVSLLLGSFGFSD